MKALCAGLTFVNISTVCSLILGMVTGGLGLTTAGFSLAIGFGAGVIAYFSTLDPEALRRTAVSPAAEPTENKRARRREKKETAPPVRSVGRRYRSISFWLLAGCFAIFAVRSFCWLLYIDGPELKIQSVNNLGDLALHITYIKTFANGVPLWPDNPIYVFSKLRYPAGVDLFDSLLYLVHVDLLRALVWTGILASLATFYAFYRWGGAFAVAGFLFNGGLPGFQFFKTFQFLDYQGVSNIGWKSIPLSMFVTQRGLLYAIPAALLLLWHWRESFFRAPATAGSDEELSATDNRPYRPLPFWIELSLYGSMPLFHVHTFLALTIVLIFLFAFESVSQFATTTAFFRREKIGPVRTWFTAAPWSALLGRTNIRKPAVVLVLSALLPATYFVWLITDHFGAASMLKWQPGWVQNVGDFKMPFFEFWWVNFGIWVPLVLVLLGWCGWRAWQNRVQQDSTSLESAVFLSAATGIFLLALLVKTAPWEWDNLKLLFWAYFIVLPYLWTELIARWPISVRAAVCIALFGSGFVSLFGGLASPGFSFANRGELDGVGVGIRNLPVDARFAGYPTYNHPLLLQGRKMVLGYPGHLWTQGFDNYGAVEEKLRILMQGGPDWAQIARGLRARYLFWGREEKTNYPGSLRPWEHSLPKVASGEWGEIYDLQP